MRISGFLPESFQDWDKGLCSVIFTGGCNFACPGCYARKLVHPERTMNNEELLHRLKRRKIYIEKVVICGGEPTMQHDLIPFLRDLRKIGLGIKLDTNGSNPNILEEIRKEGLADYVAMDVKGPKELYSVIAGRRIDLRDDVEKGMGIVTQFQDYEFRTTAVPVIENGEIRWMTPDEMGRMAKWVADITGETNHGHYLQGFTSRGKEDMLDERLAKENLPEQMYRTPHKLMHEMHAEIIKYLPNSLIR
jgi:pyruvate formate lyase activating enzyme